MNNAAGEVAKIPLSVFGGAVTEMAPSDLPEGASPFNQDCDFLPGSVFTRGGRQNIVAFANLFVEDLAGIAITVPDGHAPAEAAWISPSNATLNVPGSYASASLGGAAGSGGAGSYLDTEADAGGMSVLASVSATPSTASDIAIVFGGTGNPGAAIASPGAGWTALAGGASNSYYQKLLNANSLTAAMAVSGGAGPGGADTWAILLALFGSTGAAITFTGRGSGAVLGGAAYPQSANIGPFADVGGTGLFVLIESQAGHATDIYTGFQDVYTVTDSAGNVYTKVGQRMSVANPDGTFFRMSAMTLFYAPNVVPSVGNTVTINLLSGPVGGTGHNVYIQEGVGFGAVVAGPNYSQALQATNFNFNIPATQAVVGLEAELFGHQTTLSPDAVVTATLILPNGQLSPKSFTTQLTLVDGVVVLGLPSEGWGIQLTPALLNNPLFGVQITAQAPGGESANFFLYAVKLKAFLSPQPPQNFNYVKTYERQDSGVFTLALDAGGILWQEDAVNTPGILSSISTAINPGSFAKSVTFENTEYIAFTDLVQGTDVPRQWTGSFLDRVSQVGPAAPPSCATTSTGSTVKSITQNTPYVLITNGVNPNAYLLISSGPSAHGTFGTPATPGNVMSIFLQSTDIPPAYFKVGSNIQISGFPTMGGFNPNNDPTGTTAPAYYTITSVGGPVPGENAYVWITFQVPFTTFSNPRTPAGCNLQSTEATLTMAAQVPFLEVGNQFALTGVTPAGWNNTFTVTRTPNAAVLQINSTSLTGNVAHYDYTLISGTAPVVGQFINVNGTLNGNGIFNVLNAVIASVAPGTFSINLTSPNINAAAEANANASIYGTIFVFDPAGTVTNPIIGNAGATGSLVTSGVIGVGIRRAVCIFQTRNGALTQPSPYVQFNVAGSASAIAATAIPIGPPNTAKRIIAFTGAGGGNYFWIPQPVTVISNGQPITYGATVVNDNVSTQATFSFPDAVLLSALAIDIQGNNLFAQLELGSCRAFLTYADRLIAIGVQNKIQNLLNLSFDGGVGVQNLQQLATQPAVTTYPLGWTVDSTNGAGGKLLVSPIFGNSFYINNATGITKTLYGMITQPAFVNQVGTPIVTPGTKYSCRVTARCPSGVQTGSLVVDFFSPVLNQIFGSFAIPLSTMSTNMAIFTGTLLTAPFSIVPKDLLIRIYAANIPNTGDVEIDRIEPFDVTQPTFGTQFFASYAFNQEAFDGVTGLFGPAQNQQRANGGMVLFDTLYMLKEASWYSTSDNGVTEPYKWNWRTVSDKVGTIGIHSYDYGESWALTACREGVYFFEGGEPIKIAQEIQTLWDMINWKAGSTIWLKNDVATKTVKIGVPLPTPNIYMPEFPVNANPTTPNVVLNLSYRELNTGAELAHVAPIRSSFSGRLLAPEPARKWAFWNIKCPYADMIDRGNNSKTMLFCTGYADSKIFQLSPTQLSDDGAPINSFYITCGLPRPEQAAAMGIDVLRMQFDYLEANLSGTGSVNTFIYPEDPQNPLPYTLDPAIPLDPIPQGNTEITVNMTGNRAFIRVGTNAVGSAFKLSGPVIAIMSADPWAPVRGTARGKL
jgi:hypothetical protein